MKPSTFALLLTTFGAPAVAQTLTAPRLAVPAVTLALPNPVLVHVGQEQYQANGKSWVRQTYRITNRDMYPAAFWTAAPTLPACGGNASASRAWVDIFTASGQRLYGYCAATSAAEFNLFGFQIEQGRPLPAQVYVVITDRQTGRRWQSNLSDGGGAGSVVIH
ncbi:hypothetical protein [Sphingomonas sp.]|uniref:hypothetical protein n=1 Tax=Sphingomonas sp. TaxID=28214 RepID=UPI003CC612DA